MRFNKVLLVNPRGPSEWLGVRPPAGLGYLAQVLQDNEIEYSILDMQLGYSQRKLFQRIGDFEPDLIGFSLVSLGYKRSYDLMVKVKALFPNTKIICGGPHVSILKKQVLKDCKVIDYGVVYEGERTLVELCKSNQDERLIKGVIVRDNGNLTYSGDRDWISDLDKIPFPRYHRFELRRYIREIDIFSSRGCPQRCVFCPNAIIGPYYRAKCPENVVNEIEYWYEKGYRQFNFDDDNFNLDKQRVYKICDEIERRGLKDLYLRCSNGLRADTLDRHLLSRMKEVGFQYIAIGADAGNNRVLKMINKGETIEQIEQAVKDACELGFDVKLLFIIGHLGETASDVNDSLRIAQKYPIVRVHFYNLIPYPGTEAFEQISNKGYFLIRPEQYLNEVSDLDSTPIFETPELPRQTRVELLRKARQVQKRVTIKGLERMCSRAPRVGRFLGYMLASRLVERMVYKNFVFRKLLEYVRYKKAIHQ